MKENREVTDINVGDIEEILKKFSTSKRIKMYELLRIFKREGIENFVTTRKKYVDVILSDYKRVLKENEELKADNYELNNRIIDLLENIPIQKIKDMIEKLDKKEQKLQKSISSEEREEYSDANISWSLMDINIRREVLQELIEEKE